MLKPIALDSLQIPLEKVNLIEAAAGTGKTYTIQNLTVRLLLEKRVPMESIVILSFTNKAADELSERILRVLNNSLSYLKGSSSNEQAAALIEHDRQINPHVSDQERCEVIKTALRDFDLAQISTINGFFQRILSEFAFESGVLFNVELETNSGERLKQLYWNWFRRRFYHHPFQELLIGFLGNENELIRRAMRFADEQTLSFAREPEELNVVLDEVDKLFKKVLKSYRRDEIAAIQELLYVRLAKKLDPFLQELDRGILSDKLLKLLNDFSPESLSKATRKEYKEQMVEVLTAQPFFSLCGKLAAYGTRLRQAVISDALFELRASFEAAKKGENFMTYNDQNIRVDQALQAPDGTLLRFLQQKFKIGIIDEFQDTSGAQYRIFKTLFSPAPGEHDRCCFLVGDPRQAIYRFRGGDLFVYFQAREAADNIYYLDCNHRSSPLLVKSVNLLFAKHPSPFGDENLTFPELQAQKPEKCPDMIDCHNDSEALPPLRLNMCSDSNMLLEKCAARISCLLAPECGERVYDDKISAFRPIGCNDIVVLVRGHRQAENMRRQLLALDIPAMCLRTGSIFASGDAAELYQVLYALHHSSDRKAVNGALLTGICGMTLDELPGGKNSDSEEILPEELDKFYRCAASWREHGFEVMFEELLSSFNVKSRFAALANGERKLVNLMQLQQLLQQINIDGGMSPESLLAGFAYHIVNSDDRDEKQSEMLVSDHPVVRIMTIHASKGLGFPIVMLPDLQQFNWESNADFLCHNQEKALVVNAFDDLEFKQQCIIEEHQEHLRLLYVAMTRAKFRCEIFMDSSSEKLNALDYLLAPGSCEVGDVKRRGDFSVTVDLPKYELSALEPFRFFSVYEKWHHELTAPPEIGTVHPEWRIVSYSFLSRDAQAHGSPVDRDVENDALENGGAPPPESGFSPFKLPGGNLFGTALHEIFEKSDFNAPPEELRQETERVFRSYGISCGNPEQQEKMLSGCADWLYNICHTPLAAAEGSSFTLSQIGANDRKNEMEFYFGLGGFDLHQVVTAVDEYVRSDELQLRSWPERWQAELSGGILNGFIDLVFRWQGRYYIIDWKSNRLGGNIHNFAPEKLKGAMVESFYFFQYLLYTVALVRHLRRFSDGGLVGEAEYEQLFGGVYYLFVRGMVPEHPGYGVFRARPPWQVVSALEQVLCG